MADLGAPSRAPPGQLVVSMPDGSEEVFSTAGPEDVGGMLARTGLRIYDAPAGGPRRQLNYHDPLLSVIGRVYAEAEPDDASKGPRPVLCSHKLFFPGAPERGLTSMIHMYNGTDRVWVYRVRLNRELHGTGGPGQPYLEVRSPHSGGVTVPPGDEVLIEVDVISDSAHELRERQDRLEPGKRSPFKLRIELAPADESGQPMSEPLVETVSVRFADPPDDQVYDIVQQGSRYCSVPDRWWEARVRRQLEGLEGSRQRQGSRGAQYYSPSTVDPVGSEFGVDATDVLQELNAVTEQLAAEERRRVDMHSLHAQLDEQGRILRVARDEGLVHLRDLASEQIMHEERLGTQRRMDQTEAEQQQRTIQELTRKVEEANRQLLLLRGDIENEGREKTNLRLRGQVLMQEKQSKERAMVDQLVELECALRTCERHDESGGCVIS